MRSTSYLVMRAKRICTRTLRAACRACGQRQVSHLTGFPAVPKEVLQALLAWVGCVVKAAGRQAPD